MLFPTLDFFLFFVAVYALYALIPAIQRYRKYFFVFVSFLFYASWSLEYLLLLLFIPVISYTFGQLLFYETASSLRRVIFITGAFLHLLPLFILKYFGFTAGTVNSLFGFVAIPYIETILPVGISFFTFQSLAYLIEMNRESFESPAGFWDVLCYVTFFPQIAAGPIIRPALFFEQLQEPAPHTIDSGKAFFLIASGLFKKVILAHYLSQNLVIPVFEAPELYSSLDVLLAVYGFTAQIYVDFSGYSDIAIGIALLFGFRYPDNFNQPYRALSVQDFWRRWHISLSTWLLDYVFTPLQLKFRSLQTAGTVLALLLTFFISGLWHGASWNFIIWGSMLGVFIFIERFLLNINPGAPNKYRLVAYLQWFVTFHLIAFSWVVFFSTDLDIASGTFATLMNFSGSSFHATPFNLIILFVALGINFIPLRWSDSIQERFGSLPAVVQGLALGFLIILLDAFGPEGIAPFIYFSF